MNTSQPAGGGLVGDFGSLLRSRMHQVLCADAGAISVSFGTHRVANEQVGISRRCIQSVTRQAVCAEGNGPTAMRDADSDGGRAMLDLQELHGETSDVTSCTRLDGVVSHLRMKFSIWDAASLHFKNPAYVSSRACRSSGILAMNSAIIPK